MMGLTGVIVAFQILKSFTGIARLCWRIEGTGSEVAQSLDGLDTNATVLTAHYRLLLSSTV